MRLTNIRTWMRVAALWLLAFCPSTVLAHEFWIEPSTFVAVVGQRVDVALRVGEHFKGEPVPRKADRIVKFAALRLDESGELQEQPISGDEGDEPAGSFEPSQPGSYVLVFQSNHAQIELEGEKFEAYLEEKGIDAILKLRAERNESDKPAKEIYSRCAKALVIARNKGTKAGISRTDAPIGMPLEIVLKEYSYSKDTPVQLIRITLEVQFHGRPLNDVQVTAQSRHGNKTVQEARTRSDGVVSFLFTGEGPWLIECTHMRAVTDRDDADYESFWASLTFEGIQRP